MRKLDPDKKIQFDSLVEIRQALSIEAERLADLGMKGSRIKTKPAHLLNWLACWYLELPAAQRERIAEEGKVILDRHRQSDEPIPFGSIPGGVATGFEVDFGPEGRGKAEGSRQHKARKKDGLPKP